MDRDKQYDALQDIGRGAAECLAEMVAALECDYDRLEDLRAERRNWLEENPGRFLEPNDPRDGARWALAFPDEAEELAELEAAAAAGDCTDRDDAERRIREDPLSVEVRSGWHAPGDAGTAEEFCILLGTGGPAVRIIGALDEHAEPTRARIQAQDWGTAWTDYTGDAIGQEALLTYCRQFWFGEG